MVEFKKILLYRATFQKRKDPAGKDADLLRSCHGGTVDHTFVIAAEQMSDYLYGLLNKTDWVNFSTQLGMLTSE